MLGEVSKLCLTQDITDINHHSVLMAYEEMEDWIVNAQIKEWRQVMGDTVVEHGQPALHKLLMPNTVQPITSQPHQQNCEDIRQRTTHMKYKEAAWYDSLLRNGVDGLDRQMQYCAT
jgi:hypothetical protein